MTNKCRFALWVAILFATIFLSISKLAFPDDSRQKHARTIQAGNSKSAFDGYALYMAACKAMEENNIALADPKTRREWAAEWENKHNCDGMLDTVEGTQRAIADMIASLHQPYNYLLNPDQADKETEDESGINVSVHYRDLGSGIAYIRLDNFDSKNLLPELKQALCQAHCARALILDLRHNRGGWVYNSVVCAQLLLPEGKIVMRRDRDGDVVSQLSFIAEDGYLLREEMSNVEDPSTYTVRRIEREPLAIPADMPIIVLVDPYTASAAEVLVGALQYNRRAIVVGEPTWGKGIGQTPVALPYGYSLHVNSFEFFPAGYSIQYVGIIPDLEVIQPKGCTTDLQLSAAVRQAQYWIKKNSEFERRREELRKQNEEDELKRAKKR